MDKGPVVRSGTAAYPVSRKPAFHHTQRESQRSSDMGYSGAKEDCSFNPFPHLIDKIIPYMTRYN